MGGGASKLRVATLKGHTNDVRAVASYTTQAGAMCVVSGSRDKTLRVWRTPEEVEAVEVEARKRKEAQAAEARKPTHCLSLIHI